ncbi:MAG: glycoside hydrolase family 65 protein [Bacteroidota bacterium]
MKNYRIIYEGWDPEEQKLRESLCTLGNGYFATRGAAEENKNNDFNYPGTYIAGGFNRAKTDIAGKTIENEDFVNFPNWLYLSFRPENGKWLNLEEYNVDHYRQELDMKHGLFIREFTVTDQQGRRTKIKSSRMVSMRDKHMAAIHWKLTPENWSGTLEISTALDGTVINAGVPRYQDLESHHLEPLYTKKTDPDSILLKTETKQSKIAVAEAARTRIYHDNEQSTPVRETTEKKNHIAQHLRFDVSEEKTYEIEKIIALYTSRDKAISEPALEAEKAIMRSGRFRDLQSRNAHTYKRLWNRSDIEIGDGKKYQKLVRLHIFHILQTVSMNSIGEDVGVPARGLHGEAYRGHIFWDELFIFPFINLRFPKLSNNLLNYRFYRLGEAKHAAREKGKKGAMFPWQSGSNGRKESQVLHLNPKSGRWIPDNTHLQYHINSAIAYNVWNYYLSTDDQEYLYFFGAEVFLNIASFWQSMAVFNEDKQRYEIHNVVGPDEYHTSMPDSDEPGLNNNAYTNVMVAWVMKTALEILDLIGESRKQEFLAKMPLDEDDLETWDEISTKMYVPFIDEHIIEQFEGYNNLKEFPWEEYRKKYDDIQRLDRILESEDDTPNRYKANKQADVLMLFYLFSTEEISRIFHRLGYNMDENKIIKNIDYYRKRTSHGSTLSRLVFSWVSRKYDKQEAWEDFEKVLISDFEDIQGGTTPEGIHLGAMAGSLDMIQRGFAGLQVKDRALWIKPNLPKPINKISMQIKYHDHWIHITINKNTLKVSFEEGREKKVNIGVIDKIYEFKQGKTREFRLE